MGNMVKILPPFLSEVIRHALKRPFTIKYPFERLPVPEGYRGKQAFDPMKCVGCALCAKDCPSGAIEMVEVGSRKIGEREVPVKMPMFILERCIWCFQCEDSCPRNAISATKMFELATSDIKSLIIDPRELIREKVA